MHLSVGTSGFSYAEWKGPFYPADLSASGMLAYYAEQLPAVEINNTFYRLPRRSVLEGWAAQVPDGFRFAVKASQRITHLKRLKDVADETRYLLDVTQALNDRLGVLLFQLPPNLKLDLERFDRFLELLPAGTRAAFEFRHASWADQQVLDRLRARACAWVVTEQEEGTPPDFLMTAPWTYLRLRRPAYAHDELAAWATRLLARDLAEAFVFFKHEDAGAGPRLAREFLELAGRAGLRRAPRAVAVSASGTGSPEREVG
jgi:uncharacterized protein YecE (DUF72 family)